MDSTILPQKKEGQALHRQAVNICNALIDIHIRDLNKSALSLLSFQGLVPMVGTIFKTLNKERSIMKSMLMAIMAVAVAVTFSAPAFAGEQKKEEKKGGHVVVYGEEKKKEDKGKFVDTYGEEKKKEEKGK